jgi:hypothetical protein
MALVGGPESYGMRIQLKFKGDYWLSLNPILDLQVGKASGSDVSYTYVNTRAINFRGGLGDKLNFQPLCLKVRDVWITSIGMLNR